MASNIKTLLVYGVFVLVFYWVGTLVYAIWGQVTESSEFRKEKTEDLYALMGEEVFIEREKVYLDSDRQYNVRFLVTERDSNHVIKGIYAIVYTAGEDDPVVKENLSNHEELKRRLLINQKPL